MRTTFIYALNCPITGDCRYVGKADDPQGRLVKHITKARNGNRTHVSCWIKSLLPEGKMPVLEILQEVPFSEWKIWERVWIKASREIGYDLTNLTDGGDGTDGYKHTPEAKEKNRIASLGNKNCIGKKHSPEAVEKSRRAHLGTKRRSETLEKMALAHQRINKYSNNTSGVTGVGFDKRERKWYARIRVRNVDYALGNYKNIEDAILVRHLAEDKYFA